jgi:cytochrome bd-type quinol oxidase subunit 2
MMNALRRWAAVAAAAVGLAMAGLVASIAPASECSTAQEVHWGIAAPFFAIFLLAGAYSIAAGTRAQRLTLFLAIATVMAAYVAGFALSLPRVFQTEIGCAAEGAR